MIIGPWTGSSGGATAPFLEKIPLFALAAASATVTLIVQRHGGMVKSMQEYSFPVRWATAVESYVRYIGTILWPRNLVFPTSHPGADISPWGLGSALLLLAAISALALLGRRRWPHLFVGWFWFLATLAPVVGVVQVADQGTADRYLYVPLIGAGMILAWGAPRKPPALARGGVAVGILALGLLVFMTRTQIGFWRDDESLFGHAVRASQGNYLAEFAYGNSLQDRGHLDQAEEHLRMAITLHPQYAEAHNNIGRILRARGRNEEARGHFEEALRIWPGNPHAHNNLGNSLLTEGRKEEAISHYQQAVSLAPTFALAYANLGAALLQSGRIAAAFAAVARALEEDPSLPEGHGNLGAARSLQGDLDGAIDAYGKALELNPDLPNIHLGLAMALERRGRPEGAAFHYREALRLVPGMSQAREALARLAGGARR